MFKELSLFRKLVRISSYLIIAGCIYGVYDHYRAGYFNLPDIPENAYTISFKNGFRAIVIDPDVSNVRSTSSSDSFRRLAQANPERKYLGLPYDVPTWFESSWSTCRVATETEEAQIRASFSANTSDQLRSARLDAICFINTDDDPLLRGLLFSVPKG